MVVPLSLLPDKTNPANAWEDISVHVHSYGKWSFLITVASNFNWSNNELPSAY